MRHIKPLLLQWIEETRKKIIDSDELSTDTKNEIVDELDELQETIVYRE